MCFRFVDVGSLLLGRAIRFVEREWILVCTSVESEAFGKHERKLSSGQLDA